MGGATATTVLEGDRQWNLVVRFPPKYRDNIEAIGNIKVAGGNGGNAYIPLSELADISLDTGASYIYHQGVVRMIPIKFSVRGRDSLLALAGIPFAVGGGIIALYVSGLTFSISAAIGFVSLFGVSVMDGILMITYFNQVRIAGMGTLKAMFRAAEQRMRPMLMTALSACIGLLPAAMSHGISQVQRPLATVVVGGMLIGPIMLLVVVPALRMMFVGGDDTPPPEAPAEEMEEALDA